VFICKIRAKIEPFGINIETLWGRGYTMPPESKVELRGMIEAQRVAQTNVDASADSLQTKAST
jgi:two-component system, cell cycle response regulator CtrA